MKFLELVELFEKIEKISSRTDMATLLVDFLERCDLEESQIVSYLILGRIAPVFVDSDFNYSERSILNVLSSYSGQKLVDLRKKVGDIGDTVSIMSEKLALKGENLSITEVYTILWKIANTKGSGSIKAKDLIILECIKRLTPLESKYFVRIVCGDLRVGLNAKSLLDVYSILLRGDKSAREILDHAYGVCPDSGYIASIVKRVKAGEGESLLSEIDIKLGVPVISRLVERVGSFEEVIERFPESFILQPKFDGLRCQIHKFKEESLEGYNRIDSVWSKYMPQRSSSLDLFTTPKGSEYMVRLFTRNLEDVTEMFPEIVDAARNLPADSFIMDSEIVGWNYEKDTFLSYQETMQRRRKHEVTKKMETIPVKAFVFDLLYMDGESLVTKDTKERIDRLKGAVGDTQGGIELADSPVSSSLESLTTYFENSVGSGLEGIIVKRMEGGYLPGARNYEWVKLKRSMEKGLVDSVDMVVVGYYYGSGRRADFGVGAILCAVLNENDDTYDAICKVGTGMDDKTLKNIYESLELIKEEGVPMGVRYVESLSPDVWVKPKFVVSVEADEITRNISDGKKDIGAGLSLRFPRLIEFDRDKLPEDITTVGELEGMFDIRKSSK